MSSLFDLISRELQSIGTTFEDIRYVIGEDKYGYRVSCSWEEFLPLTSLPFTDDTANWRVIGSDWEIRPSFDSFFGEYSVVSLVYAAKPPKGEIWFDVDEE